jgi:hypothetical protein
MFTPRRLLTGAGLLAFAAGIVAGPVGQASAAVDTEIVQISGSFFVVDDDVFSDPTASSSFSAQVALSPSHSRQTIVFPSACAGDEVRAELRLELIRLSDGRVYVQDAPGGLGLQLFEGTSCSTTDLDGSANIVDITSLAGSADNRSASAENTAEVFSDDSASVSFRVTHTR